MEQKSSWPGQRLTPRLVWPPNTGKVEEQLKYNSNTISILSIHTCIYTVIMTQSSSIIPHLGADIISLSATMPTEGLRISGTFAMILISPNPMCMHNKQRHAFGKIHSWGPNTFRQEGVPTCRAKLLQWAWLWLANGISMLMSQKFREVPPKLSKRTTIPRSRRQMLPFPSASHAVHRYTTNLKSMFWRFLLFGFDDSSLQRPRALISPPRWLPPPVVGLLVLASPREARLRIAFSIQPPRTNPICTKQAKAHWVTTESAPVKKKKLRRGRRGSCDLIRGKDTWVNVLTRWPACPALHLNSLWISFDPCLRNLRSLSNYRAMVNLPWGLAKQHQQTIYKPFWGANWLGYSAKTSASKCGSAD